MPSELINLQQQKLDILREKLFAHNVTPPRTATERSANVYGLLGPRGSGKSTILNHLYEKEKNGTSNRYFLPPRDCSLVPEDVVPGAAVLIHLLTGIKAVDWKINPETLKKDFLQLEDLIGRYNRASSTYQDLAMELSSSSRDFDAFMLKGQQDRFELGLELDRWLEQFLTKIGCGSFVVLLDDIDLVPGGQINGWVRSFLDELAQSRLLFVITADLNRLHYLSLIPEERFDDVLGRALINKFMPPNNRIMVDFDEPKTFRPFTFASEDTLGALLDQIPVGLVNQAVLLESLLPKWPRGLHNLYMSLSDMKSERLRLPTGVGENDSFLGVLANCRGEPLLARRLQEANYREWAPSLLATGPEIPTEAWLEMVSRARTRPRPPSRGLQPLKELKPFFKYSFTPDQDSATLEPETDINKVTLNPRSRDPEWTEPLRHDHLRIHPLRDAAPTAYPLWTELLVDLSMAPNAEAISSYRNKAQLLEHWGPLTKRLNDTGFKLKVPRHNLRDFLSLSANRPAWPGLLWLDWPTGSQHPSIVIGFSSLLTAVVKKRDPFLSAQLNDLLIDPSEIQGSFPEVATATALEIIPNQVWALVVLAESLDRCPWVAFSRPTGWDLGTLIGLAAAFVRSAFAHALQVCGLLPIAPALPQQRLMAMIDSLDPLALLRLQEEEVWALLQHLFNDNLEKLITADDALSQAARAFLISEPYRAVVALFERIYRRYERDLIDIDIEVLLESKDGD